MQSLLKLSPAREEQFVLAGGIPLAAAVLGTSPKHQALALKLLSTLPLASVYTASACQTSGLAFLMVAHLDVYPQLLDSLAAWAALQPALVTEELAEALATQLCAEFAQLVQASNRIIPVSPAFAEALRSSQEFSKKLAEALGQLHDRIILNAALNTLRLLCRSLSSPRVWMEECGVLPCLQELQCKSQDEDLVVVEDIVGVLLEIHAKNIVL